MGNESVRDNPDRNHPDLPLSGNDLLVISDSLTDGAIIFDKDGRIIAVNKTITRLLGYESGELKGRKLPDTGMVPSELKEAFIEDISRALGRTAVMRSTYPFLHKNGQTVSGEVRYTLFAGGSRLFCTVSMSPDASERVRAEEEWNFTATLLETQQETSLDGILIVNETGEIISYNQRFVEIWDLPEEIVESRSNERAMQFVADNVQNSKEASALVRHLYKHSKEKSHDEIFLKDGRILDRYSAPMFSKDGKYYGRVWYFRDITEYRQSEKQAVEANRELIATVKKLEEKDLHNGILSEMRELLQACSSLTEIPVIIRVSMNRLFPHVSGAFFMKADKEAGLELAIHWNGYSDGSKESLFDLDDCWSFRRGRVHIVENAMIDPVCSHLEKSPRSAYVCIPLIAKGTVLGLLHLAADRSIAPELQNETLARLKELSSTIAEHLPLSIANVKLGEELRLQSLKDPLTGLYNRRHMLDSLKREIIRAERKRTSIGVVMIDIDHFKEFNDAYGHGAGDELLRQMGHYLASHVRGSDVACRYGGEEFILFLPELSTSETFTRMMQILKLIPELEVRYDGRRLEPVTLSMGIATYPNHGKDEEILLKVADAALYRAKQEGRNRICIGVPVA